MTLMSVLVASAIAGVLIILVMNMISFMLVAQRTFAFRSEAEISTKEVELSLSGNTRSCSLNFANKVLPPLREKLLVPNLKYALPDGSALAAENIVSIGPRGGFGIDAIELVATQRLNPTDFLANLEISYIAIASSVTAPNILVRRIPMQVTVTPANVILSCTLTTGGALSGLRCPQMAVPSLCSASPDLPEANVTFQMSAGGCICACAAASPNSVQWRCASL